MIGAGAEAFVGGIGGAKIGHVRRGRMVHHFCRVEGAVTRVKRLVIGCTGIVESGVKVRINVEWRLELPLRGTGQIGRRQWLLGGKLIG